MIPNKDIRNASTMFSKEEYDFLAPLQILDSNNVFDYMLYNQSFTKQKFIEKDKFKESDFRNSIIREFMCNACPKCDDDNNVRNLQSVMPKDSGFIRNLYDLNFDLFFQNPIDRCVNETNQMESADVEKVG